MWTCESCGTQGIAGDLMSCPTCAKERAVPRIDDVPAPARFDGEHGPELADLPAGQTVATGGVVESGPVIEDGPAPFVVPPQGSAPGNAEDHGDG